MGKITIPCPIHQGEGQDAFHGDLGKNVFHCFSCGAGGNVLDLVAILEQCPVREAALRLQQRYLVTSLGVPPGRKWLREAQLVTEKRGGNPVLWFGSVTSQDPRYRFPAAFRKSAVLFNYHRAVALADKDVVIVEGFFDAMRVHQAGFPSVVALMGAALSSDQKNLLIQRFRRVTLMLDGDQAGQTASHSAAQRLAGRCHIRQIEVGPGRQPDEMSDEEIRRALE